MAKLGFGWGDVINTGLNLFGNLYGAHKQSQAANQAAELMAQASKYQADLQAKAQADAMLFQQRMAQNAFLNSEAARRGNYGIFGARERRLGTIGEEVGLGPREIPDYVPGVDPGFPGAPGAPGAPGTDRAGAAAGGGGGALPERPSELAAAIAGANQIAYGGRNKHDDPSYWQAMWAKDPGYTWRRLLGEGAGGADVAIAGPFAGRQAAASAPTAHASMFGGPSPYVTPTPFLPATIAPGVPQAFGYYA